ncbi:hypothetical protein VC83_02454 [Pseudogymnoascus destructans]|uniref:Uncharacterized protein n=2 Tax=Pseudogymnoascus destructans TaxID=655981 RepID=L8FR64_PSED2|nr:uncharacterized protein VC83_02454 [Pseudogymnoascus destructans]ELR03034.1 hypothetical protein GMDG_05884 [Pseudogymnoascus destructans 20631-21]OAF61231.1 hypothetical protein VC83_02454 [Pseudogymnoascus destructans]
MNIKEDVLKKVLPEYPIESTIYGNVHVVLMEKVKRYRYSLIEDLILHVKTAMNVADGSGIRYSKTLDGLGDMFRTRYTAANFLEAFRFIHHYIDLEKSSDLAQYYVKELYINACARTKLMMDWKSDPNRKAVSYTPEKALRISSNAFP